MTPPYTPAFFQAISDGSTRSARAVVPLLMSLVRPKSVVDVGCGWGKWLTVFREAGVKDVLGIDGPYVDPARTDLAANEFIPHDLTQPLTVKRRFDLAVSLEVAEHLPPEAADGFVSLLASLAPVVAFSAAIPGQGGTGHRNERWPDYSTGRGSSPRAGCWRWTRFARPSGRTRTWSGGTRRTCWCSPPRTRSSSARRSPAPWPTPTCTG